MGDKKIKLLKKERTLIKLKGKKRKNEANVVQIKKERINELIFSGKSNFNIEYNKKEFPKYNRKYIINISENEKINISNNKSYFNNSKYAKNTINLFYLFFIFLIQLFLKKYNASKIELTISGPGVSKIFDNKGLITFPQTNFPTQVYIENKKQAKVNSEYNFVNKENKVTLIYNKVNNMDCMFCSCSNITKIDFTNFDSSEVTIMTSVFKNCLSVNEINLSKFKTSIVSDISYMFQNCKQLKYLDLSSFDIKNIRKMMFTFNNCESLISINLSSFKKSIMADMTLSFTNCYSLISVDLSKFETSNLKYIGSLFKNCKSLTSVDISKIGTTNVRHMDFMFYNCISLTSLNLSNFDGSSVTWVESMFDGCQKLEYINLKNFAMKNNVKYDNIFNEIPENIFICLNEKNVPKLASLIKNKKCFSIDITDNPSLNKKEMIILTEKCKYSCKETYEYIYPNNNKCYKNCYCISCNDDYYPKEDEPKFKQLYFNCYKNPERYYLNEQLYKLCYKTCKSCNIGGNYINHNCLTCKNDFPTEIVNSNNKINCYEKCSYYYYFYEKCSDYCEINDLLTKRCIIKPITNKTNEKEIIKIQDTVIHNINKSFTSLNYNSINIDNGEEEVINYNKLKITLTTTDNQNNNINDNTTTIDLNECEKILRYIYNISNDKKIYILKIEVKQEKMKIPKIEYDVYYKENELNLVKLNLNYCKNCRTNLLIPIEINENLDILNSSSGYYNDLCYTTKSDSGTDITLTDRRNDFIAKNKTVCQEDCIFADYDKNIKKVKCSCKVKEPPTSTAYMNIDTNKLLKNFIDIKNIANIGILVCYKRLLSFKGIIKNIGCLIVISIIIFHFISMIIFYYNQFNELKKKIIYIIFSKYVWSSFEKEKKSKKNLQKSFVEREQNKFKPFNEKQKKRDFLNQNQEKTEMKLLNLKKNNKTKNQKINQKKNNKGQIYNHKAIIYLDNKRNKNNQLVNNNHLKTIIKKAYKLRNKKDIKEGEIIKEIKKIKEIIKFNSQELNDLNYTLALQNDKRKYCEYYSSLIKTKHNLIFSFYYNEDYNSKIIKIDLFFFSFVSDFAINALFFDDDTMHKIYEEKGKFQFLYQLPQMVYSFFISYIFNMPLNFLALSEDDILTLKNDKSKKNLNKKQQIILKKIRIKFLLYFITSTILLLLFWYYISIFCVVYIHTQMHLIQDTLLSFSLSLIYPFIIYLLPGIFRIPSLSDKKKQKKYLFIISKVLQML